MNAGKLSQESVSWMAATALAALGAAGSAVLIGSATMAGFYAFGMAEFEGDHHSIARIVLFPIPFVVLTFIFVAMIRTCWQKRWRDRGAVAALVAGSAGSLGYAALGFALLWSDPAAPTVDRVAAAALCLWSLSLPLVLAASLALSRTGLRRTDS